MDEIHGLPSDAYPSLWGISKHRKPRIQYRNAGFLYVHLNIHSQPNQCTSDMSFYYGHPEDVSQDHYSYKNGCIKDTAPYHELSYVPLKDRVLLAPHIYHIRHRHGYLLNGELFYSNLPISRIQRKWFYHAFQ